MAKAFSIASWNVEHFKGDPTRTSRVIGFLKAQNPDVIGIYEVEGSRVITEVTEKFPKYTFQITEGRESQEILVGFKSTLSVFITQRLEFKSGTTHMRPGLLATIMVDGKPYSILFLHLASSDTPRGFGLRDDMAIRAIKFRKALDKAVGDQANYIFLGDLNTMGLNYPYQSDIDPATELKRWDNRATAYYDMRRLSKTQDVTFSNGSGSLIPDSNLDHVYASKNLRFKMFQRPIGGKAEVAVRGWVDKKSVAERDQWIERYSDHCLLYLEAQKIQ
jgi:endonuclease/exonuclease/phosphatase family metal-dependent hydrolase